MIRKARELYRALYRLSQSHDRVTSPRHDWPFFPRSRGTPAAPLPRIMKLPLETRFVIAAASVALLACSGGTAEQPEERAHPSASSSTDEPAAAADPHRGPSPEILGGSPILPPHVAIAKHCPAADAVPGLCLENAEGHAGETVSLEVHLVASANCDHANEASGRIFIDKTRFALANEEVGCIWRHQIPDTFTPAFSNDLIEWKASGGGNPATCVAPAGIGKVDVIQVKILPNTPPGDYELDWQDIRFWGDTYTCQSKDNFIAGKIRVLP